MELDASLPPISLRDVPELARAVEEAGFGALWASETQHDPFLPLALAAEHTRRILLGTSVAIGFARSPAVLAYTAWDLAQAARGRMILGLGTQVRAHVERRFGMEWPASPSTKLRDAVGAIRALWNCWQTGDRLRYRSPYFTLTLMTPFFNPGPIDHPSIPIYLAGVNPALCRLAGEVADGFHVHPYHSAEYVRQVVQPSIEQGAKTARREARSVKLAVTVLAATDESEATFVRSQIAFYASTPSYRPVMAFHGWGETADQLREHARRGAWGEMGNLITDEMLSTYAVVASPEDLGAALLSRYRGVADRLTLYQPFIPGSRDAFWRRTIRELAEA